MDYINESEHLREINMLKGKIKALEDALSRNKEDLKVTLTKNISKIIKFVVNDYFNGVN